MRGQQRIAVGLGKDRERSEAGMWYGWFHFLLVLDLAMRNSVERKNTGLRWKLMSKLGDLDFAEDNALLSSKLSDLQEKTTIIKEWAEKAGLKINTRKTKTMRMNVKVDRHVKIDGKDLEDVLKFTYIGSKVKREGGACDYIKYRLQKARNAFLAPNQVWKSSIYSVKTKVKIFNSKVKSVLVYGSECWRITMCGIRKCEAFQNRCLRRILRIYWPKKMSNQQLRERTNT